MTTSPKVTVLMAAFNSERFLKQAIDSILNQTFTDFEFIIVNDASTDSTSSILKDSSDPRIRVIANTENLGLIESLNKGLALARGQFIARQDDDDISSPNRLARQVELLDRMPNLGLIGTYFRVINEMDMVVQDQPLPTQPHDIHRILTKRNCFAHGSVMFRAECVKKVGTYRPEFQHCEDFDLWLRISQHYACGNIPEYLYLWRLKVASISFIHRLYQSQMTHLAIDFHQQRLIRGSDPVQRGEWASTSWLTQLSRDNSPTRKAKVESLNYQGFCLLLNNRSNEAFKTFLQSWKMNPLTLNTWFWLLMCGFRALLPFNTFCRVLKFLLDKHFRRLKR